MNPTEPGLSVPPKIRIVYTYNYDKVHFAVHSSKQVHIPTSFKLLHGNSLYTKLYYCLVRMYVTVSL